MMNDLNLLKININFWVILLIIIVNLILLIGLFLIIKKLLKSKEREVYISDDKHFSDDGYSKKNRRVIILEHNKKNNEIKAARITSLRKNDDRVKKGRVIPLSEKYDPKFLPKKSGVYNEVKEIDKVTGKNLNIKDKTVFPKQEKAGKIKRKDFKNVKNKIKKRTHK